MHIFCAVAAVTFMVLPSAHAAALWLGGLFVYYSVTAFGQPEHTGRREWPALQTWLGEQLERFLPQWLGECGGQGMGSGCTLFSCPVRLLWLLCAAQVLMLPSHLFLPSHCLPPGAGSLQVVLDGGKETAQRFDPQGRYVFGFVHHGLYPLGEQ